MRVLGLDLGTSSIGWALVERAEDDVAVAILDGGVRIFDAGVEGDIKRGADESRNKQRREARMRRRLLARKARRSESLRRYLEQFGMSPEGVDNEASASEPDRWLYHLRAKALYEPITLAELGRVLLHLNQRRGFRSNRHELAEAADESDDANKSANSKKRGTKSATNKKQQSDDDQGEKKLDPRDVKRRIESLAQDIRTAGKRTVGEYFATLDPHKERIRNRYLGRDQIEEEFRRIWDKQREFHPDALTDERREKIHEAIFFQRPLKPVDHLIGWCDLVRNERRAPMALPVAQRVRMLQKVNDLCIVGPHGERRLSDDERAALIEKLEQVAEFKLEPPLDKKRKPKRPPKKPGTVWALLGLEEDEVLNLAAGGHDRLLGDRTASKMRATLGTRWDELSSSHQAELIELLLNRALEDDDVRDRLLHQWEFDEETAEKLLYTKLEPGYSAFSRTALSHLVAALEKGTPLQSVISDPKVFPQAQQTKVCSKLPPVEKELRNLRNPIVTRVLTEVRHVVNAIVKRHGKPDQIVIELARDLKHPKSVREKTYKRMQDRGKERQCAWGKVLEKADAEGVTLKASDREFELRSRADIEKAMLAEECGWCCPYTGLRFGYTDLFGANPTVDVEHIRPRSRCLDNSFVNKTLCHNSENRKRKKNQTPYEAYHPDNGGSKQTWHEILVRVKQMKNREKLRRFTATELDEGFSERDLRDTSYASTLAAQYLCRLYGVAGPNRVDKSFGKVRVRTSNGRATGLLRSAWGLNAVLQDGDTKYRYDHRHHAVDAIVLAATSQAHLQRLSEATKRADRENIRIHDLVEAPAPDFFEQACHAIDRVVVSHRLSRRVRGPMHKETHYSPPRLNPADGKKYYHVRKAVESLTKGMVERIVDPRVRAAVQQALVDSGESEPKKAFKEPANLPAIVTKNGRSIPIRRVRIREAGQAREDGEGTIRRTAEESNDTVDMRYVRTGKNHHMAIYKKCDGRCVCRVVPLFDAYRLKQQNHKQRNCDVIDRNPSDGREFLLSIVPGDLLLIPDPTLNDEFEVERRKQKRLLVQRWAIVPQDNEKDVAELDPKSGTHALVIVTSVSSSNERSCDVWTRRVNDAWPSTDKFARISEPKLRRRLIDPSDDDARAIMRDRKLRAICFAKEPYRIRSLEKFGTREIRKVIVTPLGEIRWSNT